MRAVLNELALYQKGKEYLENKENEKALEIFKQLVGEFPRKAVYQHNLGLIFINLRRYKEAILKFNIAADIVVGGNVASLRSIKFSLARAYALLGEDQLIDLELSFASEEKERIFQSIMENFKKSNDILTEIVRNFEA